MKKLIIVNPRAGRGSALKTWQRIAAAVAKESGVEAVIPTSRAETQQAAAAAVRDGAERVIVIGGDGTIAAVADELVRTDTVLGVVPAGTGNDFSRNNGLPHHPEAALKVALEAEARPIDVGQAAGRLHFLNAAGVGFDAEVAALASRYPAGLGGTLPYLLGALSTLTRYRPTQVDLMVDDQRFTGPAMLVVVANGRHYGGGMQVAPQADQEDGQFDICIAGDLSPLEFLGLLRRVYAGGHTSHPKVQMLRGREVRLHVAEGLHAHLDGELFAWETLTFQVEPKALLVAVPPAG